MGGRRGQGWLAGWGATGRLTSVFADRLVVSTLQTIRHKESKKIRYLMTNKNDMLVTTRGGKVRDEMADA